MELTLDKNKALIIKTLLAWYDYWYSYSTLSDETGLDETTLKKEMKILSEYGAVKYQRGLMDDEGMVAGSGWFITYPWHKELEQKLRDYEVEAPTSYKEIYAWTQIHKCALPSEQQTIIGWVNIIKDIAVKRALKELTTTSKEE